MPVCHGENVTQWNNIQYIQALFFTFLIKKNVNIFFVSVQMNPFDLFKKIASMQLRTNL